MIHQFIFGAPKPGFTAQQFQDYWVNVHAVKFASKIKQIRQYLVDTRIPFDGDVGRPPLPHQGIAEIWLANAEEQLASLQSEEFLQGARLDEPNWAAFWSTIVVDTVAHELVPGPRPRPDSWVKVTTLIKRRPGLPLDTYRKQSLESYAAAVAGLPGLRRHLHCHTVDGAYTFGEAGFDAVDQLWFDDVDALRAALASAHHARRVKPELEAIADPAHVFSMTCKENWIIPGESA
ncbi:EthD domain-containing protein [Nonomuraea sp. NPDC001684]